METTTLSATNSSSTLTPLPDSKPTHGPGSHGNPIVAFIIGLAIILLASILNAAGLNLTKLDHVRTSAIPKASRRKDWLRPLWLLGMILYILSQLIGSTLALEYMRAEYVAPLGSSSLIFNFLFARFLVGSPVTSTDVYGTIIVILGVIGIVAFGSINSGLATETDVNHLTHLWRRPGWLGFFFLMTFALLLLLLFTIKLDEVLVSRNDVSSVPFAGSGGGIANGGVGNSKATSTNGFVKACMKLRVAWQVVSQRISEYLEMWTAAKDDQTIAWILGIGWACNGGGLAGGTLVFAKATVKLISGSLSHENPGNQFGHPAPIFTMILLAVTAVMQIICLNRGLKVYDSTLVVPVFYGIYTATGFLDSLIFNDEVDAYQSWTLFLIFVSILILISGVVLLTHKKPEPGALPKSAAVPSAGIAMRNRRIARKAAILQAHKAAGGEEDDEGMTPRTGDEGEMLWAVGDVSDDDNDDMGEDEDIDHHQHPLNRTPSSKRPEGLSIPGGEEERGLMARDDEHEERGHSLTSRRQPQESPRTPFIDIVLSPR